MNYLEANGKNKIASLRNRGYQKEQNGNCGSETYNDQNKQQWR